jgi:hypothetical protein
MLEPAMQAIVQTTATLVVEGPYVRANSAPVLDLLAVVPLLTSQSYSLVIKQALTGGKLRSHMQLVKDTDVTES